MRQNNDLELLGVVYALNDAFKQHGLHGKIFFVQNLRVDRH